eukprot:6169176-Amphidinium_carterae.1
MGRQSLMLGRGMLIHHLCMVEPWKARPHIEFIHTDTKHPLTKAEMLEMDCKHYCGGLRSAATSILMFPSERPGLRLRLALLRAIKAQPHLMDA